jgi:hypothetical protein
MQCIFLLELSHKTKINREKEKMININIPLGVLLILLRATYASEYSLRGPTRYLSAGNKGGFAVGGFTPGIIDSDASEVGGFNPYVISLPDEPPDDPGQPICVCYKRSEYCKASLYIHSTGLQGEDTLYLGHLANQSYFANQSYCSNSHVPGFIRIRLSS